MTVQQLKDQKLVRFAIGLSGRIGSLRLVMGDRAASEHEREDARWELEQMMLAYPLEMDESA